MNNLIKDLKHYPALTSVYVSSYLNLKLTLHNHQILESLDKAKFNLYSPRHILDICIIPLTHNNSQSSLLYLNLIEIKIK